MALTNINAVQEPEDSKPSALENAAKVLGILTSVAGAASQIGNMGAAPAGTTNNYYGGLPGAAPAPLPGVPKIPGDNIWSNPRLAPGESIRA